MAKPGQATTTQQSALHTRLIGFIQIVGPSNVAMLITGAFILGCVVFWLGGLYVRVFVISAGTFTAFALIATWIFIMATPATQTAGNAVINGGDAWKVAYSLMRQSEGTRCVHDPVRTLKGITQGTYDRYRRDAGLGPADVCTSLTEREAEMIYYRYYWVSSGASQIATQSPATAITFFDMAVNAGNGVAKNIYSQCGNNARCFNDSRESFYRSSRSCHLYCNGWLNRLARIRKVTEG